MFLFCLLIAYVIIRMSEDVNASVRGHENPRHAYRMKKLEARAAAGRRVPTSGAGRYLAGLVDDGFDSAYHRRQLMADHRAERRERRAARKIERQRNRWEGKDAKRAGKAGGPEADEPTANVDPAAPETTGPAATVDPTAAPAPAPVGFHVRPPELPVPAAPNTSGTPASSTDAPTGSTSTSAPAPAGPPAGSAVATPRVPLPAAIPGAAVGFNVPLPVRANLAPLPSPGASTQALSEQLTERVSGIDPAGHDQECVYPLTEAQQTTVDAFRSTEKQMSGVSGADFMALPVSVRADLLDEVASVPGRYLTVAPGAEDVEALAVVNARHRGTLNPADVYVHPDDAHPEIQARMAAESEQIAAAQAARAAAESSAASGSAGMPTVPAAATASLWEDGDTGFGVPAAAASACACGAGTLQPVPETVHADEGDGSASIATRCDSPACSIESGHSWTPTDAEYAAYFGHTGADTDAEDEVQNIEEETSTSNVIPFPRNSNFVPTRMEFPMTSPNNTGEITGVASAIDYAAGLQAWCTHVLDQVSAILGTATDAHSRCEQAMENLRAGGVSGPALTEIAQVQEQVVSAASAVRASLSNFDQAGTASGALQATLQRHKDTVGEAYVASPDAGSREFNTAE